MMTVYADELLLPHYHCVYVLKAYFLLLVMFCWMVYYRLCGML